MFTKKSIQYPLIPPCPAVWNDFLSSFEAEQYWNSVGEGGKSDIFGAIQYLKNGVVAGFQKSWATHPHSRWSSHVEGFFL